MPNMKFGFNIIQIANPTSQFENLNTRRILLSQKLIFDVNSIIQNDIYTYIQLSCTPCKRQFASYTKYN